MRRTVSVVLPTLGDPLLADALDSVAAQTYEHVETVVVDGSETGLPEAIRDRADVYEYQEPAGLSVARNRGIELASGEYVALLDEDDLLTPESIETRARALDGGCDVVYGDWFEVGPEFDSEDHESTPTRRAAPAIRDGVNQHVHQFVEQGLRPSAMMVRASCFERHRFDPDRQMAEDFHLWVRLAHDFRVCAVDESVCHYRVRPGSLSRADRDRYRAEKLAAIADLLRRYPDLQAHADRVRGREWYLHGREKLALGETHAARRAATRALRSDPRPRTVALLVTLCLPLPVPVKNRLFDALERLRHAVG